MSANQGSFLSNLFSGGNTGFGTKLKLFIMQLYNKFYENGGFKSKRNILFFLLVAWGYYVFLKERGALPFKRKLAGKHVYLTGAGSGLGRLMAIKMARMGAKLSISDINERGLDETVELIKKVDKDAQVKAMKLDVSSKQEIQKSADLARAAFGDVDIVINNAGIVQGKRLLECSDEMISKVLTVNMESHFWIVKQFLPAMMRKNQGHIVSIASMAGVGGQPLMTDYCASKFGAIGMMEALRLELKREGKKIKCLTVCPFYINTGMFDGVNTGSFFGFLN
jgi:all-trans-retinol dehydrogenase (NAD+)